MVNKDLEGGGRARLKVRTQHSPGGTEEIHEKLGQCSQ